MERVKRTGRVARVVAIGVALLTLGAAVPGPLAQVCQTPLFIQEGSIEANVMILFDNSGSMNEAIYHPDYDPNIVWDGGHNSSSMYYINSSKIYKINNRKAYLVKSYNQKGRYSGNYLNWIYWHATEEQRDTLPRITRIHVAHEVVADIIAHSDGVRFGLAQFNTNDFGKIIAPCGADKEDLIDIISHIEAKTWTPLAESLETVLNYFKKIGDDAPIQASCQKNFVIVMTDGFPTMDLSVSGYLRDTDGDGHDPGNCASIGAPYPNSNDCSDYLDDVAYYMRHNDLRSDLGTPGESAEDGQTVVTYTIGFGIEAQVLRDAAINGDGLSLVASDAAELWLSLELVMLDIISRISTGAAVAVVSTERGTDDRLFRGKFMPGEWAGFLEAYDLPYEDGDNPIWEAGHTLAERSASDRDIFTAIGTQEYNFVPAQAANLWTAMGCVDPPTAADLINWTRGDDIAPYRDRAGWKLGDVIHSTPVVVGAPTDFHAEEDYQNFMSTHSNRTKMVYVGGNDGMLHAFYASSGHEAWAFLPEFALPKLELIADRFYCHTYSVDQTPSVKDVRLGGVWRTVLVCGGRQGGASYFALDVTVPTGPQLLWQAELPNGAAFSSEAEFANLDGQDVVLIGSGLDDVLGEAFLYVYAVETGELIGNLPLSVRAGDRNKATMPQVVDTNLDGVSDVGYVGDLDGNVWRMQFNGSADPGAWDISALYSGSQEITAPPVPGFGEGGAIYVYFGTGAYLHETDIATTDQQTFYCVYDRHDGAENPSLVDQTGAPTEVGDDDGWYIQLNRDPGERVTEPASVVAGTVFFTSYAPTGDVCAAGGHGCTA